MNKMHFTFSDLIAGYVSEFEWELKDKFVIKTSDGREFEIKIGDNCYAELVRNLGEAFIDCTGSIVDMLAPGRFLFVYGVFYNEGDDHNFEAKHIVFLGRSEKDYMFEKQDWWIKQVRQLGDFYINAQFPDGNIDYREYRTHLSAGGQHEGDARQETDTISRLVYGFASAYLMTGEDRYLEAAEKGTNYLRKHFRFIDKSQDICYWYHAIDLHGNHERKVLASEFGDDYDAIPAYEQIYALAGPTQTYRITGDPAIENDIQLTINMFQKYYLDHKLGGYFSHVDPITFSGRAESLGHNRSRKNWNSIGDHAPAFLINAVLATENPEWTSMLEYCADTITDHFQDYENSPFVNEKFHEDWSHDLTWGWQQNRGVVGHNLKIAWNLTRIQSKFPKKEYEEFAKKIAELMPEHGMDKQRTGWYDVVNRTLDEGQEWHRYAWHDRKAWWQQEQGILAYQIMAGFHGDPEYLRLARESTAFYNAWFLDHDAGGVYFNVLANGLPYMVGTEREKGSHSMSGYHSFELCFLAAVYSNLLITKQPMDFFFKPQPNGFKDNLLRVAPDMLPNGSIKIETVTIDGHDHTDFDAAGLTVKLPDSTTALSVKVRIVPTSGLEHFIMSAETGDGTSKMAITGELDTRAVPHFTKKLMEIKDVSKVVIDMNGLDYICQEGIRALVFVKQKMGIDDEMVIAGANKDIQKLMSGDEFTEEIKMVSSVDQA